MRDTELAIRVAVDAARAQRGLERTGQSARDMANDIDRASRIAAGAGSKMDRFTEGLDATASNASMAAGGIGDVAGALQASGVISEETAAKMEQAAMVIQGAAGVADLLTVSTNLLRGAKIKDAAATVAQKTTTLASSAATKAATASQWAFNAAMTANPIGLIVLAVVALVAGFVLLYKKSDTFRGIVNKVGEVGKKALGFIVDKAKDLIGWVRDKFPGAWEKFKTLAVRAFNAIPIVFLIRKGIELYGWVRDKLPGAWDWFKDKAVKAFNAIPIVWLVRKAIELGKEVRERLPNAWDSLKRAFERGVGILTAPFESLIDIIQDVIDWIGKIDFPDLPDLDNPFASAPGRGGIRNAPSSPSATTSQVTINVNGFVGDELALARYLSSLLSRYSVTIGTVKP